MAKAVEQTVSVETGLGKIKNVPVMALGWVVVGLAFAYLVYNITTGQTDALKSIAHELPKQTVLMEQQQRTLEKILDAH